MTEQMDKANKVVDILNKHDVIDDLRKFQEEFGDTWRDQIMKAHQVGFYLNRYSRLFSVFRIIRNNVSADTIIFPDLRGT